MKAFGHASVTVDEVEHLVEQQQDGRVCGGRWLNPPEWVEWVEESVPGYPPRPVPRDKKAAIALKKRTLTNLYNARPQWLGDVHNQLDAATRLRNSRLLSQKRLQQAS